MVATQQVVPTLINWEPVGQNLDIAVFDTSTGSRVALPSGVDTTADEFHPSVSSDGRFLLFERESPVTSETRVMMVSLATGQQVELSRTQGLIDPTISADGTHVALGATTGDNASACPPFPPTGVLVNGRWQLPQRAVSGSLGDSPLGFCANGHSQRNVAAEPSILNNGKLAWEHSCCSGVSNLAVSPPSVKFPTPFTAFLASQPTIKPDNAAFIVFTGHDFSSTSAAADLQVATVRSSAVSSRRFPPTSTRATTSRGRHSRTTAGT
jgi:hypothetical protein